MKKLAYLYDSALAEKLKVAGYEHVARGLYARSENGVVWRGLSVSFQQKQPLLSAFPTLAIFCPSASKIVDEGLGQIYGNEASDAGSKKLGRPLIIHLLYDRVHILCGEDRLPSSYDIVAADQVENVAKMMCEDFSKVVKEVFDVATMHQLRDRIVAKPVEVGTGAAMYAMALTYLIDQKVTAAEIDRLANIRPSPMTTEFANFMKKKIDGSGHTAI